MDFLEGEVCYLNQSAHTGLPNRVGEILIIHDNLYNSKSYDYEVQFEDGEFARVKESELTRLTESQNELIKYIYLGNEVIYTPTNQEVIINKVDLVYYQVGINFIEGGSSVVDIGKIKPIEEENRIEPMTNERDFNDLFNIFFKHYKNQDDTYTVPKQLLINLLDQIFEE